MQPGPALHPFAREAGPRMHQLAQDLWRTPRSLTGDGVRATLARLSDIIPLEIHEVPSGTAVFDWTIPKEWRCRSARLIGPDGATIADFDRHRLEVVGYSTGIDAHLSLSELQPHLHSLPDQPDAIPYVTSYYRETWGFCLPHAVRKSLAEGTYRAQIDAQLFDGSLTYGVWDLPGQSADLIHISSYVCHPQMANNELSGPLVASELGRWLSSAPRKFSYRIVLFPETIGSLTYLSRELDDLQRRMAAGFHLSCIGDERAFGLVPTRDETSAVDRFALAALQHRPGFQRWRFHDRGSDERQYQAPGIDLPVVTLCRSKFGSYREYHTSFDDLDLVTPEGLAGGLDSVIEAVELIEANAAYRPTVLGEPQLGRRGLYPTTSTKGGAGDAKLTLDALAFSDGHTDLVDLCLRLNRRPRDVIAAIDALKSVDLLKVAA